MESKIPYKKDLVFKSQEEIDKRIREVNYEILKQDYVYIDDKLFCKISQHTITSSKRYIIYDIMGDIKCYTSHKSLQKKLLEYAQQSLTDKGYTNYMAKTDICEKKLVILLDDNSKADADKEIKRIKKFNLKWELIIIGIMIVMFLFFGFVICYSQVK